MNNTEKKTIRIAICDDEQDVVELLKRNLTKYQFPDNYKTEFYYFYNGEALLESSLKYDLVFLDIEMDGIDGIRAGKLIRQKDRAVRIVFVTSHQEYAITSYIAHPFDFATKPISAERIQSILDEFISYLSDTVRPSNVVEFKGIDGSLFLELESIIAFEYTGNRRLIVFTENQEYVIRGGISEIFQLINSENFTSPHKSFIINMDYVKSLSDYNLRMTNGMEIPVAQKKLKEFRKELRQFLKHYIRQE